MGNNNSDGDYELNVKWAQEEGERQGQEEDGGWTETMANKQASQQLQQKQTTTTDASASTTDQQLKKCSFGGKQYLDYLWEPWWRLGYIEVVLASMWPRVGDGLSVHGIRGLHVTIFFLAGRSLWF